MVQWVTVLDAKVSATAFTGQFHHFPLPAARAFTSIGEDLTFLLSWIRATVSVNVLPNSTVRGLSSGHRYRHVTKWAYRYLDVLLVSGCTVMLGIGHMVCAENARAGVTLKRQKIQALTARLRTVSPQVRKLHRRAGRGCSGGKEREAEQLSGSPSGSEPRAPLLGGGLPVPPLPLPRPARVTEIGRAHV